MHRPIPLFRSLLIAFVLACCCCAGSMAQTQSPYYRFQYHRFHWRAFHTASAHIYFPEGADSLCAFVARKLPGTTALIRKRMGTGLQQSPNVIIYPSTAQLYESNAGSGEPKDVTLPTFIAKGNRLLLAYDGSYVKLEDQLRQALVRGAWESQLEAGLQAQAGVSAGKDVLPYWMKEGMIRYFAQGWPVASEDAVLQGVYRYQPASWDAFVARQSALAGQALCYYLATQYYPELPMQLYFLFRKHKPLPRALRLITKTETDQLYANCLQFYKQRIPANLSRDIIPVSDTAQLAALSRQDGIIGIFKARKGKVLSVLSTTGNDAVAYVTATPHQRTVYVYDRSSKKSAKIKTYRLPPWLNDHNSDVYPLVAWTPAGELLVAMPVDGVVTLSRYDRYGVWRDAYPLTGIDGISSLQAINASDYLLAAWRKGQSDIVSYNLQKDKYTPFTMDAYDDEEPALSTAGNALLFRSDRPLTDDKKDTVKRSGIYSQREKELVSLALDSPGYVRWTQPRFLGADGALVATTDHGREQYALIANLRQAGGAVRFLGPVLPVQYQAATDNVQTWQQWKDTVYVRSQPLPAWLDDHKDINSKPAPWLNDYRAAAAVRAKEDSILRTAASEPPSFLEGMLSPNNAKAQQAARADSLRKAQQYDAKKVEPYILQLYSAYFTAKVNNDYFINRYQPYFAYQGQFKVPATGGMAQGGFSDLFENHHFTIAYRLPAGSEGSDFFIRYNNTAKKLDWGLAYYRKVEDLKPDPDRAWVDENGRPYPNTAKAKTNYAELSLQYPLSYYSAVSAVLAVRHDKTYFPATELYSLTLPAVRSLWSMLTVAYRINKLRPTLPLLNKGFKASATVDVFKGFTQNEAGLVGGAFHVEYHQPLYRYITLVAQLSAGSSGGNQKVLYNLGGVDNNVTPRVDSTVHLSQAAPYAFQTLVTPLRGYFQNSVYGSSYMLLNADVYFPLFQSLIPIETPLSSINNLQPGLFIDATRAGGSSLYSTSAKGIQVAYGFSARTTLAGYPLRFDMGWPGSFRRKPVWYLSLNLL